MKRVLLDSSSAILLFKADLFGALVAVYQVSITSSVKYELTSEDRAGAENFLHMIDAEKISLAGPHNSPAINGNYSSPASSLDRGERDTIRCFQAGGYDFIITDDGKAAKYCSLNKIPFINALLFPKILYLMNNSSLQEYRDKTDSLIALGHYSDEVISWAENCKKESLQFAISAASA